MQCGNVWVLADTFKGGNLRQKVVPLRACEMLTQDLAGVDAAGLDVGHRMHHSIVAMPQLHAKLVCFTRVLHTTSTCDGMFSTFSACIELAAALKSRVKKFRFLLPGFEAFYFQ